MKVLVTGADGFIGSHLSESLARAGHEVNALVLYNPNNSAGWLDYSKPELLKKIKIVPGDIRDPSTVKSAIRDCDAVCHLAALISIPYSYQAPRSYVETNVLGTLNILEAARQYRLKKIIITSTSEVYGTAQTVPIRESHPLNAQSPYAATKTAGDQLALSYHASFGLPLLILRPFNTYGPRQSLRAVIPTIINQVLQGCSELKLGALQTTRDLNFVEDTVSGFMKGLESSSAGEVINIGSNYEISIQNLASTIMELMGTNVPITNDAVRNRPAHSEVERLLADNTKAAKLIGWHPKYSGLEGLKIGLKSTIEWFRENRKLPCYQTSDFVM